MATTRENAEAIKKILDDANKTLAAMGQDLGKLLEPISDYSKELSDGAEAAKLMTEQLLRGAEAYESLSKAVDATLGPYLQMAQLTDKSALANEAMLGTLENIGSVLEKNTTLSKEDKATAIQQINNLETRIKLQKQEQAALEKSTRIEQKRLDLEKTRLAEAKAAKKLSPEAGGKPVVGATIPQPAAASIVAPTGTPPVGAVLPGAGAIGRALLWALRQVGFTAASAGTGPASAVAGAAAGAATGLIGQGKTAYGEVSEQSAEMAKLTGNVMNTDAAIGVLVGSQKTYAESLIGITNENRDLGATVATVGKSMTDIITHSQTLRSVMVNQGKDADKVTKSLGEQAFIFGKLGLDTASYANAVDTLGKTYRKSNIARTSRDFATELVNIARQTGRLPKQVGEDLPKAMQYLAAYPLEQARAQFKKLNAIVGVTGVGMSEVLKIAGQFDDMGKAANQVGDLNAMLGGPYLNTLDLVNATETERIMMIKEAVSSTGQSFNDMDRFMQKAIAQALSTDVESASKIFMGESSEINARTAAIDTQAKTLDQLAGSVKDGAAKNATSLKEQKAAAMEGLVLYEKAYTQVDETLRKLYSSMQNVGTLARKNLQTHVVDAFMAIAKSIDAANKALESGDIVEFAKQQGGTLWGKAKAAVTGEGGVTTEAEIPPTQAPANIPPVKVQVEQGPGTTTKAAPGGDQKIVLHNILKLNERVLADFVEGEIEKILPPGTFSKR